MNHRDKKNEKLKKFGRKLTLNIIMRFVVTMVVFALTMIVLLFIGKTVFSSFIWYGDEFLYILLKPIANNLNLFILVMLLIGFFVCFVYYWKKTLGYLGLMTDATQNIYNNKDDFVSLPPELNEIETQMNQIKINVRNSQRAAKEAEQKKNDLVVYLAHDLKTPLTSVIGYLTLLRDEEQISEELRNKYLNISLEKAERLEELINEFFEITRFNISNIVLETSTINLTRMLEQIIFEFKPMLAEKDLKCVLDAPPDLYLKIDADKMQRVFDNLMKNAVNYSFAEGTIEIRVIPSEKNVRILFKNQGNTIPKEKLERIFDQFYRLDSARASKSGGAGLGLAISKEIIEIHHGKIRAMSQNEIILFEVTLPLS